MLAKCEKRLPDEPQPKKQPKKSSPSAKAQQHRRAPVYVHSKTLVIDDEVRSLGFTGYIFERVSHHIPSCCPIHANTCSVPPSSADALTLMTLQTCTDVASDRAAGLQFLIIGSANINERSLAGTRDSEICVGTHQPRLKDRSRGQVMHPTKEEDYQLCGLSTMRSVC